MMKKKKGNEEIKEKNEKKDKTKKKEETEKKLYICLTCRKYMTSKPAYYVLILTNTKLFTNFNGWVGLGLVPGSSKHKTNLSLS